MVLLKLFERLGQTLERSISGPTFGKDRRHAAGDVGRHVEPDLIQ